MDEKKHAAPACSPRASHAARAREDQGSSPSSFFYGTTPGATRAACPAPPLGSSSGRASVASCAPLHISGYDLHVFRGSLSLLLVERVLA